MDDQLPPPTEPGFEGEPISKNTLDGGLIIEDFVIGQGDTAQVGSEVSVHYTGTLDDGTVFDSSRKRNRPFEFTIGEGGVIKGWDLGVPGMKVGGKRRLTIPAELAYGARKKGKIPPNSQLTFTIELVSPPQKTAHRGRRRRRMPEEIEDLKGQWVKDPCWDIEDSEGFEAHYDELHAWRLAFEQEQEEYKTKVEEAARDKLVRTLHERRYFHEAWIAALSGAMSRCSLHSTAIACADAVVLLLADQRDAVIKMQQPRQDHMEGIRNYILDRGDEDILDELVHELSAETAANVNNGGIVEQIEFVREWAGGGPKAVSIIQDYLTSLDEIEE